MPSQRNRLRTRAALAALLGAALLAAPPPAPSARAESGEVPTFSSPLEITNQYLPFSPGAVKVFSGWADGEQATVVETHLAQTREFSWNGGVVECRILEELDFARGGLATRDHIYLAQADDGSVWSFGETEDDDVDDDGDDDDDEDDEDEPGGWIVGQASPSDPPDVLTGADPALVMPASPQAGERWLPENLPPRLVTRSVAQSTDATVRAGGRRIGGCLRVRNVDVADGTAETLWFAPGLGLVDKRARRERLVLRASTIRTRR